MTSKTHDCTGRIRRASQGGAGPKHLPRKDAPKAGSFDASPPPGLDDNGSAFWALAVKHLLAMGYIDIADRMFLIRVARNFQRFVAYDKMIDLDGPVITDIHGNQKPHPLMSTSVKLGAIYDSHMSSLGLTPSARAKFGATEKDDDPFAEMLEETKRN